jgi:hypothetical protein
MRGDSSLIIKSLKEKIKAYQVMIGGVRLLPKHAFFDEVFVNTYRSFSTLLERMVEFTALIAIIPREDMTTEGFFLYRQLKTMECTLTWQGLLKQTPRFDTLKRSKVWEEYMPRVEPDERLVKALNACSPLMDLIRILKPSEITVMLESIHSDVTTRGKLTQEEILQAMAEFYNEPTTVTWGVSLRSALPHLSNTKMILCRCFDVVNMIAKIVRNVSESMKRKR